MVINFLFKSRKTTLMASEDSVPTKDKYGGLPLKACNNLALQQLEDVLAKDTKFETLQAHYNFELLKQLAATRSTRAYTFARNYAALKVCCWFVGIIRCLYYEIFYTIKASGFKTKTTVDGFLVGIFLET